MRLSKRSEYGLMAAVRLAQQQREGGGYLRSRQIADEEGLPAKFLEAILLSLKAAGILESKVGAGGGYRFRKRPEDVRLVELVDALEPASSHLRDDVDPAVTNTASQRALARVNDRLTDSFHDSLGSLTVGALMDAEDERVAPRSINGLPSQPDANQQREAAL
jgi:Rrf2 family protein